MKYFSIDIETTGSNDDVHQIIELGAVFDDTNNPKPIDELDTLHLYIKHDTYHVSPFVLGMHSDPNGNGLFQKLSPYNGGPPDNACTEMQALDELRWFIEDHISIPTDSRGKISLAGRNMSVFDLRFIRKAINKAGSKSSSVKDYWNLIRMYPFDPCTWFVEKGDKYIPSLATCLKRAGYKNTSVSHKAVEDATEMVRLVRSHFEIENTTS